MSSASLAMSLPISRCVGNVATDAQDDPQRIGPVSISACTSGTLIKIAISSRIDFRIDGISHLQLLDQQSAEDQAVRSLNAFAMV